MLLILAACGAPAPDPDLAAAAAALASWRRGRAALDAGRPAEAATAFASARAQRPDPVLAAWEAEALAAAGDEAGAEARYREAIAVDPTLAAARWALARTLARRGAVAEAAVELKRAVSDGAGDAIDVRLDPDWAPFLGDPAFAWVPPTVVALTTTAPLPEHTYWGSDLTVSLAATGRLGPSAVFGASAQGPVSLQSVSERIDGSGRVAELVWRVTGAGPIVLGPFTVTTAGTTIEAPSVATVADAPPGKEVPPAAPSFRVTSGDALPEGITRRDDTVWVALGPTDRVLTDPPRPQLRVVQRRGDEIRSWIGLAETPPGTSLRVGRGRELREAVAP